jgi:hypothetical protein
MTETSADSKDFDMRELDANEIMMVEGGNQFIQLDPPFRSGPIQAPPGLIRVE